MGKKSGLSASRKAIDPTLDALFSSSSGPVTAPSTSRYAKLLTPKPRPAVPAPTPAAEPGPDDDAASEGEEDDDADEEEADSDLEDGNASDVSEEEAEDASISRVGDEDEDEDEDEEQGQEETSPQTMVKAGLIASEAKDRKRKRKKTDDDDDLEARHLQRLANEIEESPASKRRKGPEEAEVDQDVSMAAGEDEESSDDGAPPVHESLLRDKSGGKPTTEAAADGGDASELDKAGRTVFLSNVSAEAVTSRSAKKTLMAHLSSALDSTASPPETFVSLRFRSLAPSTGALPRRAAFITKSLMDSTTHAVNAYAVYSTARAARAAVAALNGTVVLGRHLRADGVAHPAPVDYRRCVFVGNLGFVDDETVVNTRTDEEGNTTTERRKRTAVPMDVEEGLWRTFGKHAGKVESVRVVRDQDTRVGKGIAYVQFTDGVAVEAALLLDGKTFPPMLPRALRVSRCKPPSRTARALERAARSKAIAPPSSSASSSSKKGKGGGRDRDTNPHYVPKPTPAAQTAAGRLGKLLGQQAARRADAEGTARLANGTSAQRRIERRAGGNDGDKKGKVFVVDGSQQQPSSLMKTPEQVVFEGRRASARDGLPKDLKIKQRGKGGNGRMKRKFRK